VILNVRQTSGATLDIDADTAGQPDPYLAVTLVGEVP
jgi:hypothetical protein